MHDTPTISLDNKGKTAVKKVQTPRKTLPLKTTKGGSSMDSKIIGQLKLRVTELISVRRNRQTLYHASLINYKGQAYQLLLPKFTWTRLQQGETYNFTITTT